MNSKSSTSAASPSDLPGFERVHMEDMSEGTLTSEDLESRKKQLWLIKVPYEFDVSKLSGATVVLNGSQNLPSNFDEQQTGRRYEYHTSKYKQDETCHYKVVVPSRSRNSFSVSKEFSGHMDIIQTVNVPVLQYPPPAPPMYTDIPEGLKPRWKPFGHRTPPKINKRETCVKEENVSELGRKRKRDSSKASSEQKSKKNESGYGSSWTLDNTSTSTKSKKKKKKRNPNS